MIDLPWQQIANLGAGGMFAVIVIWIVLKFVDSRDSKNRGETENIVTIMGNQTRILERMDERQEELHQNVSVMRALLDATTN